MSPDNESELPSGERLQKVMAAAGVASRRVSEDLIAAGRVTVNGKVVTEAGRRIDPEKDKVVVDGTAVQLDASRRYVMLNKPVGVVSTLSDENGRPDLRQFTSEFEERLFNVGRLDSETSGLLLLTNDGELAHVLAHPSFGVTKTYIAKVRGVITPAVLAQLLSGVELDDGPIAADKAALVGGGAGLSRSNDSSLIEITLHSGRNRIVRRMLEAVGHPVIDLVRRSFGPLHLGTLKVGHMRSLNKAELGAILTISRDATLAARRRGTGHRERRRAGRRGRRGGGRPRRDRGREGVLRRGRRGVRPLDRRARREAPPRSVRLQGRHRCRDLASRRGAPAAGGTPRAARRPRGATRS
nr:hypothetical protein GCM10025699_56730 [Microbacterium flavescens]